MLAYTPIVGVAAVAALSLVNSYRLLRSHLRPVVVRRAIATLVDPLSSEDALILVDRLVTPETSIDQLSEKLSRLFARFPPSERSLKAMASQQQAIVGSGGRHEYAVCTVYVCMLRSVADRASSRLPRIIRTASV